MQGGGTDRPEFLDQIRERAIAKLAGGHVGVLVEAGECRGICPAESHGAIREHTFGITEMTDHFLDRPFSGRVREVGFRRRHTGQQCGGFGVLLLQHCQEIAVGDQGDVLTVVGEVFVGGGALDTR